MTLPRSPQSALAARGAKGCLSRTGLTVTTDVPMHVDVYAPAPSGPPLTEASSQRPLRLT